MPQLNRCMAALDLEDAELIQLQPQADLAQQFPIFNSSKLMIA